MSHNRPDSTKLSTWEEDKAAAEEQSARVNEAATIPDNIPETAGIKLALAFLHKLTL